MVAPSCRASAARRAVASPSIFSQAAAAWASLRSRTCWYLRVQAGTQEQCLLSSSVHVCVCVAVQAGEGDPRGCMDRDRAA